MSGPTASSCGNFSPWAKFHIQVRKINKTSQWFPFKSFHSPGMENAVLLVTQIQNGYRMEKPEFAPNFVGEMMANCWLKEPNDRPTFSQMADVIVKQIESVVGGDYLNLNGAEIENGLTKEIIYLIQTDRLEIEKL
jgi:hypothetical protein